MQTPATPETAPAAESPAPLGGYPACCGSDCRAGRDGGVDGRADGNRVGANGCCCAASGRVSPLQLESQPVQHRLPARLARTGNAFRFGSIRGDLFLQPIAGNTVSVNVLAEPLRGQQINTAEYVSLNLEQISRANGPKPKRAGTVRAAGRDAVLITRLDRSRPRQVLEITQAIWIQGDRGWVVTLANPQGQRSRYLPVLRTVLSTMQVR